LVISGWTAFSKMISSLVTASLTFLKIYGYTMEVPYDCLMLVTRVLTGNQDTKQKYAEKALREP